jgi:phosphoglycerol transferase MdoB-like AlkP superfamily enzyme
MSLRIARYGTWWVRVATAILWWTPVAATAGPWGLEVVETGLGDALPAGEQITVEVVLRNTGSEPWGDDNGWAVAAHWWTTDGSIVTWEGPRTPIRRVVAPGDTLRMGAVVETPREPGGYLVGWDIVHEGVLWVSRVAGAEPSRFGVTVAATHAATLRAESPRLIVADTRRSVRVAAVNDGTLTWTGDAGIAIAAHWLDRSGEPAVWEGRRTTVPRPVPQGDGVVVDAVVDAPTSPGVYRLQWDMVHDGVCWFSERDPSMPEPTTVIVVPRLPATAAWLVVVVVAAWLATRRSDDDGGVAAVGDVLWWLPAVAVKEWTVLAETGQAPEPAGTLIAVGGAAVLLLPVVAAPTRWRPWIVWAAGAVVSLVLWADALHLRFFGELVSVSAVRSVGQLDEVVASVASLARWRDLLLFADLVAVVPVIRRAAAGGRPRWWAALPVTCAVALAAVPAARLMTEDAGALRQVFRSTILAREIGVLDTHVLDAARTAWRSLTVRSEDPAATAEAEGYLRSTASIRAAVGPHAGVARDANLVMIQVESLQEFVIGLEVEGQEVTPFLNRWADTGLHFTEITDQTAQGRSSDAELATQVSLLPPASGAASFRYVDNDFVGLADVLADRGYSTVSAVAYDGGFWNRRQLHPAFGYAESLFVDAFVPGPVVGWGLNDGDFLHQMRTRIAALPRPFAAWLITLSLHHPFDGFPERFAELDVGAWTGTPLGNYLQTMRFLDRSLEALVTGLDEDGTGHETVVVVWGDHDAGFEWTARFADLIGQPHDAAGWYRSQRVPLLVRAPLAAGLTGVEDRPGGHVDVAPTVLALLGVDPAPLPFLGRNLLGRAGDEPVLGEYGCWSTRDLLYLVGGPALADGRCFERATLRPLPVERCADGSERAARRVGVSRTILEHDLQSRLADAGVGP